MIKMINYVRSEGKAVGRWPPDLSSTVAFQSDLWLKPQIEDDALLYSLHDIVGEDLEDEPIDMASGTGQIEAVKPDCNSSRDSISVDPLYQIAEAKRRVESAQRDLERLKHLLASEMQLNGQQDHSLVQGETRGEAHTSSQEIDVSEREMGSNGFISNSARDVDSSYFASYSGHGKLFLVTAKWSNADMDRYPRNHAKRHNPNGCLQGFHIRE